MTDVTNPETEVAVDVDTIDDFEAFETAASEDEGEDDDTATELDEDGTPIEGPAEPSADSATADEEEIEIDGKKYRVPKDAALRHADYTRKTQALAERAREVDATLERITSVSQQETQALVKVAAIQAQISQYDGIDWDAWEQTNPPEAQRAWRQLTLLKEAGGQATAEYQHAQVIAHATAQQETARRIAEGQRVLAQKIEGWSKDKAEAILDFGVKTYGFSREELMGIDNPLAIVVLHDAMEGRKVKTQAATREKIERQQAVKPATVLKGNSGRVAVSPSTTDFAAFERLANRSR